MQDLWKRALSGGKNSCREVMVAQKLFPMQAMQQIFEVSGHPSYYEVHTPFFINICDLFIFIKYLFLHSVSILT